MGVDCMRSVCVCVCVNAALRSVFVGGRENARGMDACRFECPKYVHWRRGIQTFLLGLTPQ